MPTPEDHLLDSVVTAQSSMLAAFNPNDVIQPPTGGGSAICRVIAGAAVALELWDAHAIGTDCREPFLWVRVRRRYRSNAFPTATIDVSACKLPEVAELEFGIGRCTKISEVVDWVQQSKEAVIALDDSWRLSLAQCMFKGLLENQDVGLGPIDPIGPEGGVVGWVATVFVSFP